MYVLQFRGDLLATQVSKLREEITAVLSVSDNSRGDRVVVQLSSGGGTITGYGLAAAQLIRIKAIHELYDVFSILLLLHMYTIGCRPTLDGMCR